jgi:hypothetical protein
MSKQGLFQDIGLVSGSQVVFSEARKSRHHAIPLVLAVAAIWVATVFLWEAAGNPQGDRADPPQGRSAAQGMVQDPEFAPPLGTYHYKVTWQRVGIAEATISVSRIKEVYEIRIRAKTLNVVDKIYRLRYRGEGQISSEDLAPVLMHAEQQTRSTHRRTIIEFRPDGTIESVRVKTEEGKQPKTKKRVIESEGFTLDPFSAMFMARSLEWGIGESERFEVFTGKHRYMIKLNCQGKTSINAPGNERDAWVITSAVRNMDKPHRKSKMGETIILLSADKAKEVLFMKSKTKYGKVRAALMRFEPMPVTEE